MAARRRMRCFTCDRAFNLQQMVRMNGDENENKREIAIDRRNHLNLPPLELNVESRLCINCNRSINDEINIVRNDPEVLRLNVLSQTRSSSCLICNAVGNLQRVSLSCRINVYLFRNIYMPEITKVCPHHLDEKGHLPLLLINNLRFINRPYRIIGIQLLQFLQELRNVANNKNKFQDESSFTDEEFNIISPVSKPQFLDLINYCQRVPHEGGYRVIPKKDLLTFLCKMRQGISDNFLSVIFQYHSQRTVNNVTKKVREALLSRFVPENVGFQSITRQDYIQHHVTPFANTLLNPDPAIPRAICLVDSTYTYIQKSSNFSILRKSFSVHKRRHLEKPTPIVAPDGYILSVLDPYFANAENNDASILHHSYRREETEMRNWIRNGDIFVFDRGYRDALQWLEEVGITCWMPALLENGRTQLTTEQANLSRIVTKLRWVAESRNGHFRSLFKFLAGTIIMPHLHHLHDFYNIAAAIINRYHPVIAMEGADVAYATRMIELSRDPNIVQARVEVENLRMARAQWVQVQQHGVNDFPILDLQFLRDLTFGVYQLQLAPSYIQDKLMRDGQDDIHIDVNVNEIGFIRLRIYSRFRRATTHQVFIAYRSTNDHEEDGTDVIFGYYCTCQSGARTLGTCVHIASILWFLGYARHQQNVKYPDQGLLNIIMDANNAVEEN